jgi:hypothetical protein
MAGEQLVLDPTSEGTGTQLDITDSTLGYYLISHDYPDPDPDVVEVASIDTEGANPAAGKHQPRTITIVVRCIQPTGGTPSIGTIISNLQRKVGKLFREGGTVRRVLPSGDLITFEVLRYGARVNPPADKRFVVRATADVTITLRCQPYGLGPSTSLTLTPSTATSKAPLVCTTSGVKGDMPAIGTLTINNVTADKTLLMWGLRSRYYDAASPLFYEAESCTAVTAAANAGYAGASGGGANKVMRHLNVGTGTTGSIAFFVPSAPAHIGTYRVMARVQADSANTGIVSLSARWAPRYLGPEIQNDFVPIVNAAGAALKGSWVLADLGLVTVPKIRLGTQRWDFQFHAKSTVAGDDLDWDWIALVPADEGSGRLAAPSVGNAILSGGSVVITHDTAQIKGSSANYWDGAYEGDYLRIPPSGAEGRTVEIFALMTGPTTIAGNLTDTIADAVNIDAVTATLTYRPRYLSVPAP